MFIFEGFVGTLKIILSTAVDLSDHKCDALPFEMKMLKLILTLVSTYTAKLTP